MHKINDLTMPHGLSRLGQEEAFEAVLKWYQGPKKYMILSAPTGVGKTGILTKMAYYARVLALAKTKVLLDSVYKHGYGYKQLQGKRNHACHHSPNTHKADVCAIPEHIKGTERYELCEGSGECSYYNELKKFTNSFMSVTTYAKKLSDPKAHNNPTLYGFDEAHEVPEAAIERAGINVNVYDNRRYPYLRSFEDLYDDDDMGFDEGIQIMRKMYTVAAMNKPKQVDLWSEMTDQQQIQFKRDLLRHMLFLKRIEETGKLMVESNEEDKNIWHYSSTKDGDFSGRPMTAAYHFERIFDTGHHKTLLMSATITPFIAKMLGIEDNFEYYEAPQQFPVTMRRIWDLGMAPMGNKNLKENSSLFNIQAALISDILKLRPDVSSVVLTTSKVKCRRTAHLLRQLGHDVFVPPMELGTDLQLQAWEDYRKPGAVCVSYNFWEGVSLELDSMMFIAGIKYPDLSSAFELARAERSWDEFFYRGAVNVVQGSGRIQRGDPSHYLPIGGPGNLVGKMVFLAVGGHKRIAKIAPGDFAERIVPWNS